MITLHAGEHTPVDVKATIFPDKTSQVWCLPESLLQEIYKENKCTVTWNFEKEEEFLHLSQLKMLLDTYTENVFLEMPYLPYARQDKRIDNNATFSLHTFAKLLNTLNFNEVKVVDAHSIRAFEIKNLEVVSARKYILQALDATKASLILFPDSGAMKRYSAYNLQDYCYATKVRNQLTGKIERLDIHGDVKDQNLLVVDDLCDGGATFILVAKEALAQGAKEVNLYVSHGIFSQGVDVLRNAGINRIFTYKGEVHLPVKEAV